MKKFFSWVLCVMGLVLAIFLPYSNAFAANTVSGSKSNKNYDELLNIWYWVEESDICVKTAGQDIVPIQLSAKDSGNNNLGQYIQKQIDFVHLKIESASAGDRKNGEFSYTTNLVYDGYLEETAAAREKNSRDGKVYCRELGIDPAIKLLETYGKKDDLSVYQDLICGKNGNAGLFNVYLGYTSDLRNFYYFEDDYDWPDGWPMPTVDAAGATAALSSSGCRTAVANLQYFKNNPLANLKTDNASVPFYIAFEKNYSFSFKDFFREYTGNLSSVSNELSLADKYMNFKTVCGATDVSKEEYKERHNSIEGYVAAPHNDKIDYLKWDSGANGNKVTYANGSLGSDSPKVTCNELAETLDAAAGERQTEVDAEDKAAAILQCYNDAKDNANRFSKMETDVDGIYLTALELVNQGKKYQGNGYKPVYGTLGTETAEMPTDNLLMTFSADSVKLMDDYIKDIKTLTGNGDEDPVALVDFRDVTRDFLAVAREYRDKSDNGGSLSDAEKEAFDELLATYEENTNSFLTNVLNKFLEKYNEADKKLKNFSANQYTTCLSSGTCEAYNLPDKVDGFYDIQSAVAGEWNGAKLTCTLNDEIGKLMEEAGPIIGASINYADYVQPEDTDLTDADDVTGDGDACYNAGIEGMSWILCPALNNMVKATDGISAWIEDMLGTDARLYSSESAAGKAWGYFRDIANIAVIIILLVVIVSQLTGYGIDNYGIKKILPRLIAMAIIINLSFIICQVAIDLSNILGSGLNDLFQSIGLNLGYNLTQGDAWLGTAVAMIFGAAGIVGSVGGVAVTIGSVAGAETLSPMIIIFIILVVAIAVVAILAFFLLLAMRAIIVLLFSAIAPLAFACYILPNTQGIFKKWWNVFKTALIVYPICGAVYGLSFIIRGMVFDQDNGFHLWLAMAGIIAPVLPFLLIPSLIKGALAGLGVVSGALAGLKSGVKSGLSQGQSAVTSSQEFKDAQEAAKRGKALRAGGYTYDKKSRDWIEGKNYGKKRFFGLESDSAYARRQRAAQSARIANAEASDIATGHMDPKAYADTKIAKDRDERAASRLAEGAATFKDKDGKDVKVIPNNADHVKEFHKQALNRYRTATTETEKQLALSDVRAAQRSLTKSDGGRERLLNNLRDDVRAHGTDEVNQKAAQQLQDDSGEFYKRQNRGGNTLLMDLAAGDQTAKSKVESGFYDLAGADKYDESTLVGADDDALKKMSAAVANIRTKIDNGEEVSKRDMDLYDAIRGKAQSALQMSEAKNLSIKSEAEPYIRKIAGVETGGNEIKIDHSGGAGGSGSAASNTFTARGVNGDVTLTKGADGVWRDSSGNAIEGDVDAMRQAITDHRQQDYEKLFGDKK